MNTSPNASGQWRWKPVDIIVMIVAFVLFWPLGLVFIAWKIWNDRQPNPTDLAVVFQQIGDRIVRLAEAASEELRRLFGQVSTNANRETGNAEFDAYVRRREAEIAAEKRALDEEVTAFREFLARDHEAARDAYERFRRSRR
ncbi:MAG: DUF2852 domain-containing protein [Beijerinckiaceae bacterium]|nr:DUF2852 domain-containing protein [Beijerinckiaceae bacterium]